MHTAPPLRDAIAGHPSSLSNFDAMPVPQPRSAQYTCPSLAAVCAVPGLAGRATSSASSTKRRGCPRFPSKRRGCPQFRTPGFAVARRHCGTPIVVIKFRRNASASAEIRTVHMPFSSCGVWGAGVGGQRDFVRVIDKETWVSPVSDTRLRCCVPYRQPDFCDATIIFDIAA